MDRQAHAYDESPITNLLERGISGHPIRTRIRQTAMTMPATRLNLKPNHIHIPSPALVLPNGVWTKFFNNAVVKCEFFRAPLIKITVDCEDGTAWKEVNLDKHSEFSMLGFHFEHIGSLDNPVNENMEAVILWAQLDDRR